jgi:Tfp pilus assembly protein PilF
MRALVLFASLGLALAQAPDPAYEPLTRAYEALRAHDYEAAIACFINGIGAAPQRASIRKDLAYTYLKIGENTQARDQFREAMEIDPADAQVAKEYAFLCYETKERQQARRIFDRIRKSGDAVAEQAFRNIDAPLAAGIERWKKAIAAGADNFSAHFELATLAEERDELELAAEQYEKAWRLLPERRSVLVDLGRVWKALDRTDDANAALLAASRGGEPRASETARELLPERYPYISEFRRALTLDPGNAELQRELAYLLLKMGFEKEAVEEFRLLAESAPQDLLSATQLGFLLRARGEDEAAIPLFDRVLGGKDADLANRVRAVLRLPQVPAIPDEQPASVDAKEMAERSIKAGYMKDALRYLQMAHQADPFDPGVMLKVGWTYNILGQDPDAVRWFDLARKGSDTQIAKEAGRAWRNLHAGSAPFRTTAWLYPIFSTRWRDLFSYGQVKTELRTRFPLQPYLSLRFIGDLRRTIPDVAGGIAPLHLSESSFIPGIGLHTPLWHGMMAWAETGLAAGYLSRHATPDYRGGLSLARGVGHMGAESSGWFADTALDGVFISRFGNDLLVYQQGRMGYTTAAKRLKAQWYWNANLTFDDRREDWANFWETGPGVRLAGGPLPRSAYFTLNLLRGGYLIHGRAAYTDVRVGFWYAITR